jgi:hypothetical protein
MSSLFVTLFGSGQKKKKSSRALHSVCFNTAGQVAFGKTQRCPPENSDKGKECPEMPAKRSEVQDPWSLRTTVFSEDSIYDTRQGSQTSAHTLSAWLWVWALAWLGPWLTS